ncbi:MAG: spore germination protein GerW family protein, partial [Clostridium sp.]
MSENTLQGLMKTTMDNLKDMIDVNTIVGDPVETIDGTIIIPVSKVTVGFGSGGTEK